MDGHRGIAMLTLQSLFGPDPDSRCRKDIAINRRTPRATSCPSGAEGKAARGARGVNLPC